MNADRIRSLAADASDKLRKSMRLIDYGEYERHAESFIAARLIFNELDALLDEIVAATYAVKDYRMETLVSDRPEHLAVKSARIAA